MKGILRQCLFVALLLIVFAGTGRTQLRVTSSYPGTAGYNIPFWVALDFGEFKKAGLEVDPVLISGGSKSMQALLSGGLDFAHGQRRCIGAGAFSGADVTIIGSSSNRCPPA